MSRHLIRILSTAHAALLTAAATQPPAPTSWLRRSRPLGDARPRARRRTAEERGQSTVEYALILLGAAAIALVVVAWVTRTDTIGRLFDTVIGRVLQQAG